MRLILYRLILYPLMLAVFRLLSLWDPKIRQGWLMRKNPPSPSKARGGLWIHCASGEFEYAKPVIRELKTRYPNLKIGVTYFSPSVIQSVTQSPFVDVAVPSPFDTPHQVSSFLLAAQPRVFLIARTDLWPEMLHQCRIRGIPTLLFAATLTEQSGRMQPWARWFYGWVTRQLSWIACVSPDDAKAFQTLAPSVAKAVLGDTRFDQVVARLNDPKPIRHELKPSTPTLVAGSTWPEDEAALLPAFSQVLKQIPTVKLILAPHEPTPKHLQQLEASFMQLGLRSARYSEASSPEGWNVLLVDQVGILAELYRWGSVAFVGGSFRKTVHSVMEPLAAGCVTLVGPRHHNNREALAYAHIPLPTSPETIVQVVYSSEDLEKSLLSLFRNPLLPGFSSAIAKHVLSQAQASRLLVDEMERQHWLEHEGTP